MRKPSRISAFIEFFIQTSEQTLSAQLAIYIKLNKIYDRREWQKRRWRYCYNQNSYDISCIFNGLSFARYNYKDIGF